MFVKEQKKVDACTFLCRIWPTMNSARILGHCVQNIFQRNGIRYVFRVGGLCGRTQPIRYLGAIGRFAR